MTGTMTEAKGRDVPREPNPQAVPFGSREALLRGPPPRHVDVVVQGIDGSAKYRLRELKQGELEEISSAGLTQELIDGKVVTRFAQTGSKARYVAYSLIYEDGSRYFNSPAQEYALLNDALSPQQMDALHKAVLTLNGLGEEAKEALGKASGPTGDSKA